MQGGIDPQGDARHKIHSRREFEPSKPDGRLPHLQEGNQLKQDSPLPPQSNCYVASWDWVKDSVPAIQHHCSHRQQLHITTINTNDAWWNTVDKLQAKATSYKEELAGDAEASRQ